MSKILIINSGSSSLKFQLIAMPAEEVLGLRAGGEDWPGKFYVAL
jgi:acetate kinase